MLFDRNIPGCCSVGLLHHFGYDDLPAYVRNPQNRLRAITSTSGHFIAIFHRRQKEAFDAVCKKHTLLSAVASRGSVGEYPSLAICVFKKGK